MSQLASRALLNAMLALAVLVLVLAAAALTPNTAVAARSHTADKGRDSVARQGQSNTRARAERRARPAARKRHVRRRRLSRGLRAVRIANRLTGIPYVWGGASPRSGFDCSGLVQYVYGKLGISLPHYTVSQYRHGSFVSRSGLRAGDLVFFHGLNHVGIYAGRGKYIHAPGTGSFVRWASLASNPSYYGARRIVST